MSTPPFAPFAPTRSDRAALLFVQLGAVAVVLAALPYKTFDLDRYFVPKELALHLCAAGGAICILLSRSRLTLARIDWLLLGFLVASALSAAFADNRWLSTRALTVSVSGVTIFWVVRALRRRGFARAVLWAVAIAGAVGAGTALMQAYGVTSDYFSLNRAPGGTFGNRNFMAHIGAIVAPTVLYLVLTTRRSAAVVLASTLLGVVAAAEVLSRSRAAWLALLAAGVPVAVVAWLTRGRWGGTTRDTDQRLGIVTITAGIGTIAALVLPNTLEWRSDSPYLESVRGMVNYQQGSGHGRLVQYTNSLRMMTSNPLLGVGPGNWAVEYPRYASHNDPSLSTTDDGMTSNPWPSSDWVAFGAERGVPATALLVLSFVAFLMLAAWNMRVSRGAESILGAFALGATVVVTLVVGAFDAVLLLAAPTLIVWALLGALAEATSAAPARAATTVGARQWSPAIALAFGVLAAGRSALQIAAMGTVDSSSRTAALERASLFDPGNYRVHLRLGEAYLNSGRCDRARREGHDARDLFPMAEAPRQLLAACGESSPRPRRR